MLLAIRGVDTGVIQDVEYLAEYVGLRVEPTHSPITTVTDYALILLIGVNSNVIDTPLAVPPEGYTLLEEVRAQTNTYGGFSACAAKVLPTAGTEGPSTWTTWDTANGYTSAVTLALRPAAASAKALVNAHEAAADPHSQYVSKGADNEVAGVKISVVAALPATPDPDTLYFITT
jgi:hypothetical protein